MSTSVAAETVGELFNRAFALHQANSLKDAKRLYQEVLARDPKHAHALHSLGVIDAGEGRWTEAIQWFRRAIEHTADEAIFYHNLGRTLQADGQSAEAVKTLRKATAVNPDFIGAWQALAEIYYALENTTEAARAIRKVAELQTKTAEAYNQKGVTLAQENKLKEAVEAFRAGMACNPRGAGLYFNAGNVLTALGHYADAISCLTQALTLVPKATQIYVSLSNTQYRSGDLNAALQSRAKAWQLDPKIPESRFEVSASPIVASPRRPNVTESASPATPKGGGAISLSIPQAIQQAIERHGAGDLATAEALYRKVLAVDADNADALHLYGVLLHQRGLHRGALDLLDRAIATNKLAASYYSNRALVMMALGEFEGAEENCRRALAIDPTHQGARDNLSFVQKGRLKRATTSRAVPQPVRINYVLPTNAAFANSGLHPNHLSGMGLGQPSDPGTFKTSLPQEGAGSETGFGNALEHHRRGNLSEAERGYRQVLDRGPGHVDALHMLGLVAIQTGNLDEGIRLIRQSLDLRDEQPLAHSNLGNALIDAKQPAAALIHLDRAIALQPALLEAHHNRGRALVHLHRALEAVESLDYVLAHAPRFAPSIAARGFALQQQGETEKALNHYDQALELQPDLIEALSFKGALLFRLGRYRRAAQCYDSLLRIAPNYHFARGNLAYCRLSYCEWTHYAVDVEAITAGVRSGTPIVAPLELTHLPGSSADQLQCARTFISLLHPPKPRSLWTGESYGHERIRLAYVSTDFQDHATAYLTAGLFEFHDRSRFDVTLVSLGADDGGTMRRRLQSAADRFVDASHWQDDQVAKDLRENKIDIVISLQGLVQQARWGILAHRPAPIQVSYLAHPGTSGADYVDYILADGHVIPESEDQYYSEKVVRLPSSYQVNDNKREIATGLKLQRSDFNIPENAFVFCCFNNPAKFTPDVFDVWCRLLKKVTHSILWLFEANADVAAELRREAALRDVHADRLQFVRWSVVNEHVARYSLADLFVDTVPYNAHTTASDALWAGLPVLTCRGSTFAGRVGSSLLNAVGLPELICQTLQEYESLALALARNPQRLQRLRSRLSQSRETCALFNTPQTTRDIEAAYTAMWEARNTGGGRQSYVPGSQAGS